MLKKRIIFTLLFADGYFYLSRNFSLQKVGNYQWLLNNYHFSQVTKFIDEIRLINLSKSDEQGFLSILEKISGSILIPIGAGGGIRNLDFAREIIKSGAEKVNLTSTIFTDLKLIEEICSEFGNQAVVGNFDINSYSKEFIDLRISKNNASKIIPRRDFLNILKHDYFGEIILNSIPLDGTGLGLEIGRAHV